MREFAKVGTAFWTSPAMQSLSDDGKLLALYLVSSPHSTSAGIYRLPNGYVLGDLSWAPERVSKGFAELSEKGFATRCETTFWLVIHKHFQHNKVENPNQAKHILALLAQVPAASSIIPLIIKALHENSDAFPDGFYQKFLAVFEQSRKGSERVSKQKRESREEIEGEESSAGEPAVEGRRVILKTFLADLKAKDELLLKDEDPIYTFAEANGVTDEMLEMVFLAFRERYLPTKKAYIDWRATFRNAVRENWFKLWLIGDNGRVKLTSQGSALMNELRKRKADKQKAAA